MECGFAAGDVASSALTVAAEDILKLAGPENVTTQEIRRATTDGFVHIESVCGCQVPVVSGQSVLTTDKDVGRQMTHLRDSPQLQQMSQGEKQTMIRKTLQQESGKNNGLLMASRVWAAT